MKNVLVVYYSRKGSNKYLAKKIADSLNCEFEELRPRLNVFLLFLLKIHLGIKPLKHRVKDYEYIILCGPIWMGRFVPPLKSFALKYAKDINKMVFITCCGSNDEQKDEKFGHGLVFRQVQELMKGKCIHCQAFPIGLVLPDDKKDDSEAFMKTHLNDNNFNGEIRERFENFIQYFTKSIYTIEISQL